MKQSEKLRLTRLVRVALADTDHLHPQIRIRAASCAAKFSPTNARIFRETAELVWWLIATDAATEGMRLLDALCELDDDYFWMFDALTSEFATRAWLHSKRGNSNRSMADAKSMLTWINRDPNAKAVTKSEVAKAIKRFDSWLKGAEGAKHAVSAVNTLSHALRVLVIYQQLAKAGCSGAQSLPSHEYSRRIKTAISMMKHRFKAW